MEWEHYNGRHSGDSSPETVYVTVSLAIRAPKIISDIEPRNQGPEAQPEISLPRTIHKSRQPTALTFFDFSLDVIQFFIRGWTVNAIQTATPEASL
jgi:hypothetical protein